MPSDSSLDRLLEPFLAEPGRAALFTDFDGTLAPIVDEPSEARPLERAPEVLERLAGAYGRVGVISGRPVSFLRRHLGGRGLFLSGLYGLETASGEGEGDDAVEVHPEAVGWRPAIDEAAERGEQALGPPIGVEHKGLSVTIHFRGDPSQEDRVREWVQEQAEQSGLAVHPGRMSIELRPPIERDKGMALAEAAEGFDAACFLGDDRGDLAAFDALDRMAAGGAATFRVGVRSAEAPEELLDRADVVVDGPAEALDVLERLLR